MESYFSGKISFVCFFAGGRIFIENGACNGSGKCKQIKCIHRCLVPEKNKGRREENHWPPMIKRLMKGGVFI